MSQENCCLKKTVNGINYVLAEYTGLTPDPSCLNSCIYQEENNPSSYVCFKDGTYNAECLVETSGYGGMNLLYFVEGVEGNRVKEN